MRLFKSSNRPRGRLHRVLEQIATLALGLAVAVVVASLCWANVMYLANGYDRCRANGGSALWCYATAEWQAVKALFSL